MQLEPQQSMGRGAWCFGERKKTNPRWDPHATTLRKLILAFLYELHLEILPATLSPDLPFGMLAIYTKSHYVDFLRELLFCPPKQHTNLPKMFVFIANQRAN